MDEGSSGQASSLRLWGYQGAESLLLRQTITLEKRLTLWRIPNTDITALKYCAVTYY